MNLGEKEDLGLESSARNHPGIIIIRLNPGRLNETEHLFPYDTDLEELSCKRL